MFLGYTEKWLMEQNALHTAREIAGQPELWLAVYRKMLKEETELRLFMDKVLANPDLEIILTGAGTSAYIGQILETSYRQQTDRMVRAVPTTDIVSSPESYLYENRPTLMISFARSGNSPESVAAVDIANQYCNQIYHIFITCNEEGKLAKMKSSNAYCFILPPETNDKSLAMTGSFSSMAMVGHLLTYSQSLQTAAQQIEILAEAGRQVISRDNETLKAIAGKNMTRGIFLGSGGLQGAAREAHLKLQELTDGKVMCQYDTYLGFRHGPKAVINDQSLLVFLISQNEYTQRYEEDLLNDIYERKDGLYRLAIGIPNKSENKADYWVKLENATQLDEALYGILTVVPCQILAFHTSIAQGLSPDEPSVSGNISRVVKGVNIYPYQANAERIQS